MVTRIGVIVLDVRRNDALGDEPETAKASLLSGHDESFAHLERARHVRILGERGGRLLSNLKGHWCPTLCCAREGR